MLIEKLRADLLTARKIKAPVTVSLLTALVGETVMVGKNAGNRETTDDETLAMIRKFLKNATETLQRLEEAGRPTNTAQEEILILNSYLPMQLSKENLVDIIFGLKEANPALNVGMAMKYLKEKYNGSYDGKLASEIVKDVIG